MYYFEWTCEGSPKLLVGAYGRPDRYQKGVYNLVYM